MRIYAHFNCSNDRVVRASASGAADSGLIPSRVKPMTLNWYSHSFIIYVFRAIYQISKRLQHKTSTSIVSREEMRKTMTTIEAKRSPGLHHLTNISETSVRKLNNERQAKIK